MAAGARVVVEGDKQLALTMRRAADDLTDMRDTHSQVAGKVAVQGRSGAPRVTGLLASSVRGSGAPDAATITAGTVYANPIHWGWSARNIRANPFIADPIRNGQDAIVKRYADEVSRVVHTIHGK